MLQIKVSALIGILVFLAVLVNCTNYGSNGADNTINYLDTPEGKRKSDSIAATLVRAQELMRQNEEREARRMDSLRATDTPSLKKYTKSDVAKYAIAKIMGRSPRGMNAIQKDSVYFVSYTRPDGDKFTYRVRFNGPSFLTGGTDVRWRDEDVIRFEEIDGKLRITEVGMGYEDFQK